MSVKRSCQSLAALLLCLSAADHASAYYAPHLGRWVSRDPIGYRGDGNLYAYVDALPTVGLDPLGLRSRKDCEKKLDSVLPHLLELADHFSPYHCSVLNGILDDFRNGGCRNWLNSYFEEILFLDAIYSAFCERKPEPELLDVPIEVPTQACVGAPKVLLGRPPYSLPSPQPPFPPFIGIVLPPVSPDSMIGGGIGIGVAGGMWWIQSGLPVITPWPDPY